MPENLDEDLIEATIRRVAEAKAARREEPASDDGLANDTSADGAPSDGAPADATTADERPAIGPLQSFLGDAEDEQPPADNTEPDEDLIAATIARVQAQKAALGRAAAGQAERVVQEPDASQGANGAEEDRIAATIARVQAQQAAAQQAEPPAGDATDSAEEDRIAATIARVQAQQAAAQQAAAQEADAGASATTADDDESPVKAARAVDDDAIAATLARVRAQQSAAQQAAIDDDDDAYVAPAAAHSKITPFDATSHEDPIAGIERTLREAVSAIAVLTSRVEALERLSGSPSSAQVTPFPRQETEWNEEAPQVAQGFGTSRPTILRDATPAPRTALAEQLPEPEVIDTRPLPKPLPPIQVEPRRGLDLLPRTYRITVEDKRRGVDLVPLHRALLSMDGVRDMSLLSYNNGVAIVALEMTGDLDNDDLGNHVARAMSRPARVEQHNEHTLVVKLAED